MQFSTTLKTYVQATFAMKNTNDDFNRFHWCVLARYHLAEENHVPVTKNKEYLIKSSTVDIYFSLEVSLEVKYLISGDLTT